MRYALERIKALFVREVVVFVQAEPTQPNIAQQEETIEGIAIVVAAYRNKLLGLGLPQKLADDMTLDLHCTLTGSNGNDDAGVWSE